MAMGAIPLQYTLMKVPLLFWVAQASHPCIARQRPDLELCMRPLGVKILLSEIYRNFIYPSLFRAVLYAKSPNFDATEIRIFLEEQHNVGTYGVGCSVFQSVRTVTRHRPKIFRKISDVTGSQRARPKGSPGTKKNWSGPQGRLLHTVTDGSSEWVHSDRLVTPQTRVRID
ncbi:hypothetical protein GGX14DRAFT_406629 [Mycena pura]|uniref:Uncharacterized protein n=1 Tax=Mycena pura TaxID=153505 RepID=A0AAD6Y1D2_9AGAR|nr:hypothetical protein GGX14DRAFT_406629 [Mycena pura]